jgi:hypothetical protein
VSFKATRGTTYLDWRIETFGDSDHDGRPENPKDIIKEQARQEGGTRLKTIELHHLDRSMRERETKHIREIPRFAEVQVDRW